MSLYSEFFFNSATGIAELETIEISHPSFSKVYRLVRNNVLGVTVTLEDSSVQNFDYYPMKITPTGANTDLDQTMQIAFGDLGSILPKELDYVYNAGTFNTKPLVKYRTYRSDLLTSVLFGPVLFQVQSVTFTKEGCTLDVSAPKLNLNKTGEVYSLDRFPSLRTT